ncbi:transposase [Roseomonas sp. GC11]|uniref:transposase n=1 Tax=Roseomonas sp. GC11 TaxID=2950546 RepID=UPI00210D65DD|nr:transposase [Roseomonas sp. GC11]MCQ4161012.1 transposase [Roseomonas sp. GC11]
MSASRLTPPRPWAPMTDQEWAALLPYLLHRSPQGRPLRELRQRMDGIFALATSHAPWRALPERFGKADTVARYFCRLIHAGLWQRLLVALAEAAPSHPLRAIEHFIVRATRRAHRILGLPLLVLIRRIGLRSALRAPPWLLPDPDLSETLLRQPLAWLRAAAPPAEAAGTPPATTPARAWKERFSALRSLLRTAWGRARISRSVCWGWP